MPRSKAIRLCLVSALLAAMLTAGLGGYLLYSFGAIGKIYGIVNLLEKTFYKDVDRAKLLEGAARGVVAGLGDPYSVYMTKQEWEEFLIRTSGEYSGIGVNIGVKDGRVQIISPIKGTPAEKAGLKANDVILKVDGKPVSTSDEAASLIRGPAGTEVTLTIFRDGESFDVSIVRQEISIPAVDYSMKEPGIGYIELSSFNEHSYMEMAKALSDLKSQGAKAIILDLRYNGGGLLDQCTAIAELFVPKGPIVTLKGKSVPESTQESKGQGLGLPLFVLVNEGSASASEILAGAIQDRKAGILIGTTTFGKGLVQNSYRLRDGSVVKVTIAEYLTPNGRAINGKGLEPDIKIEGDEAQMAKAMELARIEAAKNR
ncbi:MAG: S41 family peptidase [Candidatus Fermentithermobacillus carboniphilus]|uniref:S41 family peptidase n=1 Tax=Candidatus Fermentithermobacillus carboniphilus TaxID=3085328 RepID=A0AAT9LB13_9FIRM|nr:MAG: S41 family peptidase [Candidatus Fermentithermobacillus carboniphilus]